MQCLKPGDRLRAGHATAACEVVRFIGGGGQGEVYEARLGGEAFALKWYFPAAATPRQRAALDRLVEAGAPGDRFVWPFDLVTGPGETFGYLMPLIPAGYQGMNKLMKGRAKCTYRALVTAAIQLVESFSQLHAAGLCYCDISFGNVSLRPDTGDILILDNDNVAVNRSGEAGVLGTLPFMAPEIVRGEAKPSRETDLYSLAVLLFYLFLRHHPLQGRKEAAIRCFDYPAQLMLYGREPTFVFDPVDNSNHPDPDWHPTVLKLWPVYPQFLRDLFTAAFTAGVRDPDHGRIRHGQWRKALVALRDAIVYGPTGAENFYCADYRRAHAGELPPCWHSGRPVPVPYRLEIGDQVVVLNHDTKVYPHHTDPQRLWDFRTPVAEVGQHPKHPTVWGLKNLTDRRWTSRTADGTSREVEPGRTIVLADGTGIDFGTAKGAIRL